MRPEIKQALEMKNNPLADSRTFQEFKKKLEWWNLNTMSDEEREAMKIIFD